MFKISSREEIIAMMGDINNDALDNRYAFKKESGATYFEIIPTFT